MWSIEVSTIGFKLDPSWLFDNIIILIKWNLIQYLLHEITTTPAARIRSLNFQFSSRLSVNINFNFNCLTMMKKYLFWQFCHAPWMVLQHRNLHFDNAPHLFFSPTIWWKSELVNSLKWLNYWKPSERVSDLMESIQSMPSHSRMGSFLESCGCV